MHFSVVNAVNNPLNQYNVHLGSGSNLFGLVEDWNIETENQVCFSLFSLSLVESY